MLFKDQNTNCNSKFYPKFSLKCYSKCKRQIKFKFQNTVGHAKLKIGSKTKFKIRFKV